MASLSYLTSNHQPDNSNLLEPHGIWWTLLHSWSWFLCEEKTILSHDLASVYLSSFSSTVHCHCLLHVKKKLGKIPTSFSICTYQQSTGVSEHHLSIPDEMRSLAYFFLVLQQFDHALLLEHQHLYQLHE